ncbi:MAG: DeoR/GlpR family DNA-binding transcription regulator [Sphaerochaeta sp.]
MIPYERRSKILEILETEGMVNIEYLCDSLDGVSESTVRRDLRGLEDDGLVENLRGGAARIIKNSFDTPKSSRETLNVNEKEKIAMKAASLVQDGEIIYLDVGTTVMKMIKYLKNKDISIVTTDATAVQELANTNIKCMLVGGDVVQNTASLVGPLTDSILRTLFFDRAFIGTYGFDAQAGFCSPDYRESNKKRIVKENSTNVYVLADHSKQGKRSLAKAFNLDECILITDKLTDFVKTNTRYLIAE